MHFVGIQGSYKISEIALFKDEVCLATQQIQAANASSQLLTCVQNLLSAHHLTFSDLQFVVVDQGPGAFTSLRVTIATVNALAFTKKVSLIGVDGLDALARETAEKIGAGGKSSSDFSIVCLLNAFNKEVYHAVYRVTVADKKLTVAPAVMKGYKLFSDFLHELSVVADNQQKMVFTGNAVAMYDQEIDALFSKQRINKDAALTTCSAVYLGKIGLDRWQRGAIDGHQLLPLYLKVQTFAIKK